MNRWSALKSAWIGIALVVLPLAGVVRAQDADTQLNAVYQQVLAILPPARQQQLRAAERAWVVYRDKNRVACESTGKKRGQPPGQARGVATGETSARTVQLRQIVILVPPIPVDTMRKITRNRTPRSTRSTDNA